MEWKAIWGQEEPPLQKKFNCTASYLGLLAPSARTLVRLCPPMLTDGLTNLVPIKPRMRQLGTMVALLDTTHWPKFRSSKCHLSTMLCKSYIPTCVRSLRLCSPGTSMSWDQSLNRIYCFPVGILHKWPTQWNTAMPYKCFLHAWKSCKQDFDVARSLCNQSI